MLDGSVKSEARVSEPSTTCQDPETKGESSPGSHRDHSPGMTAEENQRNDHLGSLPPLPSADCERIWVVLEMNTLEAFGAGLATL